MNENRVESGCPSQGDGVTLAACQSLDDGQRFPFSLETNQRHGEERETFTLGHVVAEAPRRPSRGDLAESAQFPKPPYQGLPELPVSVAFCHLLQKGEGLIEQT